MALERTIGVKTTAAMVFVASTVLTFDKGYGPTSRNAREIKSFGERSQLLNAKVTRGVCTSEDQGTCVVRYICYQACCGEWISYLTKVSVMA